MKHLVLVLVFAMFSGAAGAAQAETQRTINASRVQLGAIWPGVPEELAGLDLGAAPPAGSSRLYSPQDLTAIARQAGSRYVFKEAVRVVRATKRWSQRELLEWVTPELQRALPGHARLTRVEIPRQLVTAEGVELSRVQLGQVPNRRGSAMTSAVLEFRSGSNIEQRVTVSVYLDLDEPPKPIELPQGAPVTLVVNLGSAKVSTSAVALQTVAVGSTALFRVVKTRKTLHAKLVSTSMAEVVGS
jgi:hypothetical protein